MQAIFVCDPGQGNIAQTIISSFNHHHRQTSCLLSLLAPTSTRCGSLRENRRQTEGKQRYREEKPQIHHPATDRSQAEAQSKGFHSRLGLFSIPTSRGRSVRSVGFD